MTKLVVQRIPDRRVDDISDLADLSLLGSGGALEGEVKRSDDTVGGEVVAGRLTRLRG